MKNKINKTMSNQDSILILNALLVGNEFLECLDLISKTSLFKQELKSKINMLLPILEKHCDNIAEILGTDDATVYTLLDGKKKLIREIAHLKPEYKLGLAEILELLNEEPDAFLLRNNIKISKDKE